MLLSLTHSRLGKLNFLPVNSRLVAGQLLGGVEMYRVPIYLQKCQIQERQRTNYAVSFQDFNFESSLELHLKEQLTAIRLEWLLEGEINLIFPYRKVIAMKAGQYLFTREPEYTIEMMGRRCKRLVIYLFPGLLLPLQAGALDADCFLYHSNTGIRLKMEQLFANDYVDSLQDLFYENTIRDIVLFHLSDRNKSNELDSGDLPIPVQVAEIIRQNLHLHLPISTLSRMTGVNECTLKKEFKKYYKMGLFEFLIYTRLESAKELLKDPKLTIKDIAFDTGYQNIPSFSRAFKKNFKVTPSQWRDAFKKNEP